MDSMDVPYVGGLTILGGEPMEPENQAGLVGFLEAVRERFGTNKVHLALLWPHLGQLAPGGAWNLGDVTDRLLDTLDVLVDGPFVQDLHDITLQLPRLLQPAAHRRARHARGAGRRRGLVGGRADLLHARDVGTT